MRASKIIQQFLLLYFIASSGVYSQRKTVTPTSRRAMAKKPHHTQLGGESDHDDLIEEDVSTNSPEASNISSAPPTCMPLMTSDQAITSTTSVTVPTTGITGYSYLSLILIKWKTEQLSDPI